MNYLKTFNKILIITLVIFAIQILIMPTPEYTTNDLIISLVISFILGVIIYIWLYCEAYDLTFEEFIERFIKH